MYLSRFCKQPLIDGSTLCDRLYCCALQVYYTSTLVLHSALLVFCCAAQLHSLHTGPPCLRIVHIS